MYASNGVTVTAAQCDFMENNSNGLFAGSNSKVRLNDCTIHHNGSDGGLVAGSRAVVDLHGEKTDIYANKRHGIRVFGNAKVNIHLPSQHNTSHDNVGEDRLQLQGGTINNVKRKNKVKDL